MSAENAKDAAQSWVASAGLPEDLRGRTVQLVTFTSDEDCRFFYPRRALLWQQQVNTYISRAVRGRKAKVMRVTLTPEMFYAWMREQTHPPVGDSKRSYADSFQKLLPPEA